MHIIILLGSPHPKGTTAQLAARFESGARAAGHTTETVFVPGLKIAPCLSCGVCREKGVCVQRDDAPAVLEKLMRADGVVFVSPLFYFNLTAQLKALIDRFYAVPALRDRRLKACLLTAGADEEAREYAPVLSVFDAVCRYMQFENGGTVAALGCPAPDAEAMGQYLKAAEALGRGF